jgi:hypothetical protein
MRTTIGFFPHHSPGSIQGFFLCLVPVETSTGLNLPPFPIISPSNLVDTSDTGSYFLQSREILMNMDFSTRGIYGL